MLIITLTKYLSFVIILFALTSTVSYAHEEPAVTFLTIWPTARSAALGGAMTGLAEDADAAFWNPGGFGFQKGWGFTGTFNNYLPGFAYEGYRPYYIYGSVGYSFSNFFRKKLPLNVGVNYTYHITGWYEIINERGEYLGEFKSYDVKFGIHSGILLSDKLGLGLGIKCIHSVSPGDWSWFPPYKTSGEKGSSFAIDLGLLYKPYKSFSIGFATVNIGPNITYSVSGTSDPLPRMFRIGFCYTPVDNNIIKLNILLEINKMLVGMFYDPLDTLSFGHKLSYECKEAWKSFGVEATIIKILSLRLGYFEDLTGARGGVRVIRNEREEYLSLFEYLFSRNRGELDKIGLTFGFGISYKDYLRFDLSSDHLIWDFSTSNLKFSLTSHDPIGLAQKISQIF